MKDESSQLETIISQLEETNSLLRALSRLALANPKLDLNQTEQIALLYGAGIKSPVAIATLVGISANSVSVQLNKIRAKIVHEKSARKNRS